MQKDKSYYLGIDCTGYSSRYQGGVGEYSRNIVDALCQTNEERRRIAIICSDECYEELKILTSDLVTVIRVIPRWYIFTKLIIGLSYYVARSSRLLRIGQKIRWKDAVKVINSTCQIVYTPTTYSNFPVEINSLVSLHDIQEKTFPNFFSKRVLKFRDVNVRNTLENASSIQVSSDFVRTEISKFYPILTKSTDFVRIEEGVQIENRSALFGRPRSQEELNIVLPANFWEHKNQKLIIDATIGLNFPFHVVFTGQLFSIGAELQNQLRKNADMRYEFKGFIPREDLMRIYQNSHIVVSTSLYESSSLPILEGIAMGCFPLASRIPAHVEMSESFNMFLFEPDEPQSLKDAILKFSSLSAQEKNTLIDENLAAILNFEWRDQAKKYWHLFESHSKS
jgi:glycosyltransferase involved in cell wall biosynthesis